MGGKLPLRFHAKQSKHSAADQPHNDRPNADAEADKDGCPIVAPAKAKKHVGEGAERPDYRDHLNEEHGYPSSPRNLAASLMTQRVHQDQSYSRP